MSRFRKLHVGGNINGLATPPGGRVRLHMTWCMVWWKMQDGDEGQKELGFEHRHSRWEGNGITACMREAGRWEMVVKSSRCLDRRQRLRVWLWLRGRSELSSFSQQYTEYAGGGDGSMAAFLKCGLWCIEFSDVVIKKSTFSKNSFWREGGSHKKSTLCTLLIMLTIMDDP